MPGSGSVEKNILNQEIADDNGSTAFLILPLTKGANINIDGNVLNIISDSNDLFYGEVLFAVMSLEEAEEMLAREDMEKEEVIYKGREITFIKDCLKSFACPLEYRAFRMAGKGSYSGKIDPLAAYWSIGVQSEEGAMTGRFFAEVPFSEEMEKSRVYEGEFLLNKINKIVIPIDEEKSLVFILRLQEGSSMIL